MAVLVAIVLAMVLARDLPRRQVEKTLARRLEAEVTLGGLEIVDFRTVRLTALEIRRMAGQPFLEVLKIPELIAEGNPGEMVAARFERQVYRGMEVRLARQPAGTVPAPSGPPASFSNAVLEVENGRIIVSSAKGAAAAAFSAKLTGVKDRLAGEIQLTAGNWPLAPILGLAAQPLPFECDGEIRDLAISLNLADGAQRGKLHWSFHEASGTAAGKGWKSVDSAGEIHFAQEKGGLRVDGGLTLPGYATAQLAGRVDLETGRIANGHLRLDQIELAAWQPWLAAFLPGLSVSGQAELELRQAGKETWVAQWEAGLERVAWENWTGRGIRLDGKATLPWPIEERALDGRLNAEVKTLEGKVGGLQFPAEAFPIQAQIQFTADRARRVTGQVELQAGATGRFQVSGRLDGSAPGTPLEAEWRWNGAEADKILKLARSAGLELPRDLDIGGSLHAEGSVRGTQAAPLITAQIQWERGRAGAPTWPEKARLQDVGLTLGLQCAVPGLTCNFDLHPAALQVALEKGPPIAIQTAARGMVDLNQKAVEIEEVEFKVPDGLALNGKGKASLEGVQLEVHLSGLDLERQRRFVEPWTGQLLPLFTLKGGLQGTWRLAGRSAKDWVLSGEGELTNAGFASSEGDRVLEGLTGRFLLDARSADEGMHGKATVDWGGFQLLWDSAFGDFGNCQSKMTLTGERDRSGKVKAELSWALPGKTVLRGGLVQGVEPGWGFQGALDSPDLRAAFGELAQKPLASGFPLLEKLTTDGRLSIQLEGRLLNGNGRLGGLIRLQDIKVDSETLQVSGLSLELPLDVGWNRGTDGRLDVQGQQRIGRLGFQQIIAGGFSIPPLSTPIQVSADSFSLVEPLKIPFLGGQVICDRLTLSHAFRPERRFETGLAVDKIQLAELSKAMALVPLEGEVVAHFPKVVVTGTTGTFSVEGGGEIALFGGKVKIGGISGADLLTRYPKLTFSATFEGLNLGQLTRTIEFGEIDGILDGYFKDVELFGGVPTRFEAEARTVERKGISRTINVKAINNVAILGTGGSAGVLNRGVTRFFKKFTYSRLGIFMKLDNDVFELRGLERRGNRELFLRGRLPFPIDVVNADPGRTVSFRSMLDRFQALDLGRMTTRKPE